MNATQYLHDLGQRLWLDNISRRHLDEGILQTYIAEYALTGLTSNPAIFEQAIGSYDAYDASIRAAAEGSASEEALFVSIALDDLRRAADLFRPIHDSTAGVDGWVSMEVSPLLAYDAPASVEAAKSIRSLARRDNLFVKIPGTAQGVRAIEESIFAGVPVNVTLLFSPEHYQAAAEAYLRGIERRIAAGLDPRVASVASLFVSRWDRAVSAKVPDELRNRLGIAVAGMTYSAYRKLLDSERWRKLAAAGAAPQRLLWASTGTKDPSAPETLYVEALAAPDTIDTMPDATLLAFARHGALKKPLADDAVEAAAMLDHFRAAGIDVAALAAQLQRDGAQAFVKSWQGLMRGIAAKRACFQAESGARLAT
ncbi:MAG: transaldolase [Betaproteobacteria bacterium]|nr:transaldolase [Betaproteobacteria bacterium]